MTNRGDRCLQPVSAFTGGVSMRLARTPACTDTPGHTVLSGEWVVEGGEEGQA